jgi:hypothetical protein
MTKAKPPLNLTPRNLKGPKPLTVSEAWAQLMRARREDNRFPRLSARVRYAVDRIGGLPALKRMADEELVFLLRDFAAAYNEWPLPDDGGVARPAERVRRVAGSSAPLINGRAE